MAGNIGEKPRNKEIQHKNQEQSAPKSIQINPIILPLGIVEIILSKLPFKSLCRFKLVSKSWNAAISQPGFGLPMDYSDLTVDHADWKTLLPPDEQQVFWESSSTGFWLDEAGKNCFMFGAPELVGKMDVTYRHNWEIEYLFDVAYRHDWKIEYHPQARFSKVAELVDSTELFLQVVIKSQTLSPNTFYSPYLVFKLSETHLNLESANSFIGHFHGESQSSNCDYSEEKLSLVHFQPDKNKNGQVAVCRDDGWMEVEMGEFYVPEGDDREIEVVLFNQDDCWTRGLVVQGIEFRPSRNQKTQFGPSRTKIITPVVVLKKGKRRRKKKSRGKEKLKCQETVYEPWDFFITVKTCLSWMAPSFVKRLFSNIF